MTDPAVPDPATDPADPADPAADPAPDLDPGGKAGAEAARYRVRLRETETARDVLAARVQSLQSEQVARLVAGRLAVPGDLFAFGLTLDDVLTDGDVDDGLVETALVGLLTERPGLAKPKQVPPRSLGQGNRGPGTQSPGTWADLIRGGR